jgi:hypothetical protein
MFAYNISARTVQKTYPLLAYYLVAAEICLFTEPLPSNDYSIVAYFAVVA